MHPGMMDEPTTISVSVSCQSVLLIEGTTNGIYEAELHLNLRVIYPTLALTEAVETRP